MKKLTIIVVTLLAITAAYYLFWRAQLEEHVARVEATIAYQNQQFRDHNRWITLKADSVKPAGFPFKSRVRVVRPTLTFVWDKETYGASFPAIELQPRDADSGTYEVLYEPKVEVVYAKSGAAPEEYTVSTAAPLSLLLRAQGDSRQCMGFPGGTKCDPVKPSDPLISYAVQLPQTLTVTFANDGKTKDANFQLIALNLPIYQRIPPDMDRALELLVNMCREAFQK